MNDINEEVQKAALQKGWTKARPEKLPRPTYWPFFLAIGTGFVCWGLLTSWIILSAGALIFLISLTGWIKEMMHEKSE